MPPYRSRIRGGWFRFDLGLRGAGPGRRCGGRRRSCRRGRCRVRSRRRGGACSPRPPVRAGWCRVRSCPLPVGPERAPCCSAPRGWWRGHAGGRDRGRCGGRSSRGGRCAVPAAALRLPGCRGRCGPGSGRGWRGSAIRLPPRLRSGSRGCGLRGDRGGRGATAHRGGAGPNVPRAPPAGEGGPKDRHAAPHGRPAPPPGPGRRSWR